MSADALSIDALDEYERLHHFYDVTTALLDRGDELFEAVPDVSGWSPAQHLDHVWQANGKSLMAAAYAAEGKKTVDEGSINETGRRLLASEEIPRGQMATPDSVAPPARLDRERLRQTLARSQKAFATVGHAMDLVPGATGRIPHPALGPLTAAEWLRFVRIHSDHHRAIVDDILRAQ